MFKQWIEPLTTIRPPLFQARAFDGFPPLHLLLIGPPQLITLLPVGISGRIRKSPMGPFRATATCRYRTGKINTQSHQLAAGRPLKCMEGSRQLGKALWRPPPKNFFENACPILVNTRAPKARERRGRNKQVARKKGR